MKNYYYSNQISEQIGKLLNDNMPDESCKNISIGDLSVLPSPSKLARYLPAIIISLDEMEHTFANDVSHVLYTPYYFTIFYVYPYTFEQAEHTVKIGKQYTEKLLNILTNYRTLDDFKIAKSETEAGGAVLQSSVSAVKYDSAEQEFFRSVEVPLHVAKVEFCVGFRTYSN